MYVDETVIPCRNFDFLLLPQLQQFPNDSCSPFFSCFQSFTNQLIAFLEKESTPSAPLKLATDSSRPADANRLRKMSSSSMAADHAASHPLPRHMTSSPFRPPTDNPLFNHLSQQTGITASSGSESTTSSTATWTPSSQRGGSRGSTTSEPEMLRELLGQTSDSSPALP